MLVQDSLELFSGSPGGGFSCVTRDQNLLVRRLSEIEEFSFVSQLVTTIPNVRFAIEFHVNPIPRRAFVSFDLWSKTPAVQLHPLGQRRAGKGGEGRKIIAAINQV